MKERPFITPIGNEGLYVLNTASWRTVRTVMEKKNCSECGICLTICPVNSISRDGAGNCQISYDYCKGCGLCAAECPKKAIVMVKEGGDLR